MADDDWRKCAQWMATRRCFAREPPSEPAEFASSLKDGVVLCTLLNKLAPGCIRPNDFSQRPQGCQFLCQKNINKFLQTCQSVFSLSSNDLFQMPDLAEMKSFQKVLVTLSKLSKSSVVKQRGIESFDVSVKNDDDDDIYVMDDEDMENYDNVEAEEEEVYESLCGLQDKNQHKAQLSRRPSTVKTLREKCLDEIIDTEKHYVEVLNTVITHFFYPLKKLVSAKEHLDMFSCLEKLYFTHKEFLADLEKAKPPSDSPNIATKIPDCFTRYKERFLIYGEYCSNLPNAAETVEAVCRRDPSVELYIKNCEQEANEGKFKLVDLFTVPFQRVLKYNLLLKELRKNTDKDHPDYQTLWFALEVANDLALYINEVKRDNETLKAIMDIQNSIHDLQMPPNTTLRDYGHLIKDGQIKLRANVRHLFLFEKVLLICRLSRNNTYKYCDAYVLHNFDMDADCREKKVFKLVEKEPNGNAQTLQFTADTEEAKKKWVDAVNLAHDNVTPKNSETPKHSFVLTTLPQATICVVCRKLLRGVFFQGYKCEKTNIIVHKECMSRADDVEPPTRPDKKGQGNSAIAKVKAMYDYSPDDPTTHLTFTEGEAFDLMEKTNKIWWLGKLRGQEGYFPAQYVRVIRETPPRSNKPKKYEEVSVAAPSRPPRDSTLSTSSSFEEVEYHNLPDTIHSQTWFVGEMSREEASVKLADTRDGTFLVRTGQRGYAISISFNGVKHLMINDRNNGPPYSLDRKKNFNNVQDLVSFYSKNNLHHVFDVIDTVLKYPYSPSAVSSPTSPMQNGPSSSNGMSPINQHPPVPPGVKVLKTCKAMFDYSANQVNQLTIREGDVVYVISTAGESRGWWKGCIDGQTGYFPCAYVEDI